MTPYPQEVIRAIGDNAILFIGIDDIVDRCYVTKIQCLGDFVPIGIPADHIHICHMKYDSKKKRVTKDTDTKPYIENVDMQKAFRKRKQRKVIYPRQRKLRKV